jgi:tryptophanyl-tRNA synthetase
MIKQRISNAFTGGRATVEEQRRLGGIPEICPVHDLCLYHFVENDDEVIKMYNDCRAGKLLCGEHKARTIEIVLKFVEEHRRKKEKFMDRAREILQA